MTVWTAPNTQHMLDTQRPLPWLFCHYEDTEGGSGFPKVHKESGNVSKRIWRNVKKEHKHRARGFSLGGSIFLVWLHWPADTFRTIR